MLYLVEASPFDTIYLYVTCVCYVAVAVPKAHVIL